MRLICNEYGLKYEFNETKILEVIVESSDLFRAFITQIWNQLYLDEEFFILSENDKELRLDKTAELILDPFCVDINNRKILSKVYHEISQIAHDNYYEKTLELQALLERYIIEICECSDYSMMYDFKYDTVDLLKLYNVRIDFDNSDVIQKLVSYIKISHQVLGKSFFVLVNLKSYISEIMIEELYHTLCYEKVHLMLIERFESYKTTLEERIIIDKDCCLIYNK